MYIYKMKHAREGYTTEQMTQMLYVNVEFLVMSFKHSVVNVIR